MKDNRFKTTLLAALICLILVDIQACRTDISPQAIAYGKDQCTYCRMTISDARFGSQLVTQKGRAYNFDDVHCMLAYIQEGNIKREEVAAFYLPDFGTNELKPAEELFYLQSEALGSPMQGNIAAFIKQSDRDEMLNEIGGTPLTWEELWK